jgi:hypothetical protein
MGWSSSHGATWTAPVGGETSGAGVVVVVVLVMVEFPSLPVAVSLSMADR